MESIVAELRHNAKVRMLSLLAEFDQNSVRSFILKEGEVMALSAKQQAIYSRLKHSSCFEKSEFGKEIENKLMGLLVLEKSKKIEALQKKVEEKRQRICALKQKLKAY